MAGSAGGGIGTLSLGTITGSGTITKTDTGTLRLASPSNAINAALNLNGGALEVDANTTVDHLVGNSTGTLNIVDAKLSLSAQNGATVGLAALSITNGGVLDLGNGNMSLDYTGPSPLSTIVGYLTTGYDHGIWDGSGITSSAALAHGATTLGYIDTESQIRVKYTWVGDANMGGLVDNTNLAMISAAGTGDFNYDGVVNADDYALFMLGAAASNGENISMTLPEPMAALSLTALAMTFSMRCRRRCQ